ncbi:MAG: CHRD domain-containing protein [Armatimonadetes bacterium]|nr:CHRD domain-containing protein [Armatimonadota bacterium]
MRVCRCAVPLTVLLAAAWLTACGSVTDTAGQLAGILRAGQVAPTPAISAAKGRVTVASLGATQRLVTPTLTGLGTTASAVQIRLGGRGAPGPLLFALYPPPSGPGINPWQYTASASNFTAGGDVTTLAEAFAAMDAGRCYLSVNTDTHPDGHVRAQLGAQVFSVALGVPAGRQTGPSGQATLTLNAQQTRLRVQLTTTGLTTSAVTAVDIHAGTVGVAGPVILRIWRTGAGPLPSPLDQTIGPAEFASQTSLGIDDLDDAFSALICGRAYLDVHTTDPAAGAIQGQIM